MSDKFRQPEMWTIGSSAGVIACLGLALLFAGFFVLSLMHHFGVPALAFGAMGTVGMLLFARAQRRIMKRRGDELQPQAQPPPVVRRRSGPARP